jgi:hypothetical protein
MSHSTPSQLSSGRTKLDFPTPRSRNAPKTFTGRYDEIDPFLKEFEALSSAYNLSNDDRFDLITRYVKRPVREIIEGLEEYAKKDWSSFADTLRKLFDHVKTEKRFKEKDLLKFISKTRNGHIRSLYDFHKYQRKFARIGGWLRQKGKVTDGEYRKYFWKGIPRITKKKLEERMLQEDPKLSRSTPFPTAKIIAAADHVFDISRFYDEDSDDSSDTSGDESDSESSDDDDNSSDDTDSTSEEDDHKSKRDKKKGKEKTFQAPSKVKRRSRNMPEPTLPSSSNQPSPSSQQNADEVADLIDKLQRMNLNDPSYASLYFRIVSKAPHAASLLTLPPKRPSDSFARANASRTSPSQPSNNGSYECYFCGEKGHSVRHCQQANTMIQAGTIVRTPEGRVTWPDGSNILRSGSETILTGINRELAFRNRVNAERPPTTNLIYDFRYYQETDDDDSGEQDSIGKVYATEVYPVARQGEERRDERRKKVKFDGVYPPPLDRSHRNDGDEAKENKAPKKATPSKLPRTSTQAPLPTPAPATVPERVPTQVPIQPSNPTHIPAPLPYPLKPTRPPPVPTAVPPQAPYVPAPVPVQVPYVPLSMPPQVPNQVPVQTPAIPGPPTYPYDATVLPFDPEDDDQIMEDISDLEDPDVIQLPMPQQYVAPKVPRPRKIAPKPPTVPARAARPLKPAMKPAVPRPIRALPKILPRPPIASTIPASAKLQSQCYKEFNSDQFFQKICDTPITITLSEALGSSPFMSKRMREYLQLTRVSQTNNVGEVNSIGKAASFHPHDARLISIRMNFDNNHTVDTLIDCGSELDIINKNTCIKSQIPIDTSLHTYMRDAGLHDTLMEGRCHNVNLTAGNLVTTTDLWVGGRVPFSLLLGRPWQRRNRISIDERETGTWLCRRDPSDKKIWETCVVPARHAEEFFNSFQSHFFGQDHHSPDTLLAQMTVNPQVMEEVEESETESDDHIT